ncbi:glycerophosphodiester phosphodiesterase family protein [uncultured Salinisphaera sp.]|uniref:glycerophosphodiester phosphodiesterase family protein n=1 Tax=uncultured Salinisphaera sp. TaxID=359372 RepID=UPI0032B238C3|tara:strand:- start:5286 stop:6158 length:873 start_codon:yes stop_codon:yes gene_type:complete
MSIAISRWSRVLIGSALCAAVLGCSDSDNAELNTQADTDNTPAPIGQQLADRYGVAYPAVVAHRGNSFHAPEETRPAFELARAEGADYLEADLQRTRDGVLVAIHDTDLRRTTNIEAIFPERAADPVNTFTLAELKRLDAGSWFNDAFPERARASYVGQKILTLDELREIAEDGDNQPGLYLETKAPALFPGIEADLADYLQTHDWIGKQARQAPEDFDSGDNVSVGYSRGRVILQTFSTDSLARLNEAMPNTPKILLLFLGGEGYIPADPAIQQRAGESDVAFQARQKG